MINWKNLGITIAGFLIFAILLFSFVNWIEPIESAKANSLEPGCTILDTIGTVVVARCYDEETGAIFYANSVGWAGDPIE